MDVPALLDACDMTDPMIDRKSMMTYIAQFRAYEQRKRLAAPRDHGSQSTVRHVELRVDDPSELQRCDAHSRRLRRGRDGADRHPVGIWR